MRTIDAHEFKMLKTLIGYRYPEEIYEKKINDFRRNLSHNNFQTVIKKSKNEKDNKVPSKKVIIEEWEMVDLKRQEQICQMKERAKARVDQRWQHNPFISYRDQLKDGDERRRNINFISRNIANCDTSHLEPNVQTIQSNIYAPFVELQNDFSDELSPIPSQSKDLDY